MSHEPPLTTADPASPPGWYQTAFGWQWWDGRQWYPPPPATGDAGDEKTLAVLSHLGPLIGGFVLPLVVFLVAKDKPYVRHHACESLNFAITYTVASMASMAFVFLGLVLGGAASGDGAGVAFGISLVLGFVLFFVVLIAGYVFAIVGAVKASRMEWWRYPVNIRLVKP